MKLFVRSSLAASALVVGMFPLLASTASATVPAPAAPAITHIVSGNRAVSVFWTETTTPVAFVVSASAAHHTTRVCHTTHLTCNVVSLANGVSYSVTVSAKNVGGTTVSSPVSVTVGVPGAPNNLHVKLKHPGIANVAWNPPVASGVSAITKYNVTATDGTNSFVCSTSSTLTTPAARACVISGLTVGTHYSISVTASNVNGTGGSSKVLVVTAI